MSPHGMVIPRPPPAPLLRKRPLLDDHLREETGLLPPAFKKWCPGVVPHGDGNTAGCGLEGYCLFPMNADGMLRELLTHVKAAATTALSSLPPVKPIPDVLPPALKLEMGSAYVPKERGVHPLGEDAHFVSEKRSAFGVADGVGGWTPRGIDAGVFARQLMAFCHAELEAAAAAAALPCSGSSTLDLQGVLERALARTTARGSSTAIIAAVDGGLLRAVSVGDSGFIVVRGDQVIFHSPTQYRPVDVPYQLGGVDRRDPPECAKKLEVRIQPGDLIVAGTDGLFDNLYDDEIQAVLERAQQDGHGAPQEMAHAVALAAVKAFDGELATPFTVAHWKADRTMPRSGGKPDDVTVVVARVR